MLGAIAKISGVKELYITAIKKLCMKHHYGSLPIYMCENVMPKFNVNQLQNKNFKNLLRTNV